MAIDIVPVRPEHADDIARIMFEAFAALHDRHATPRDFDDQETARMVTGLLTSSSDFRGYVALQDGRVIGSNFLSAADQVAGVGPITVDPSAQARGVGRALMQAVLDDARERGVAHVRLNQEAINTASLSLYSSLGFAWRDSVAVMLASNRPAQDPPVRAMTTADLPAVHALSTAIYGHSRRNEVAANLERGFPAFALERAGKLAAYLLPGFFGHGFAGEVDDMAALISHAGRHAPPAFHRVLVPLSNVALFNALLRRGSRTVKVLSYMAVGPWAPPRGTWLPSILN